MSDIKTIFAMVLKGEPERTLIKAGILNSDETFTPDGQDLFLAWLLKEHGADFKKEVAEPILSAQKEAKK